MTQGPIELAACDHLCENYFLYLGLLCISGNLLEALVLACPFSCSVLLLADQLQGIYVSCSQMHNKNNKVVSFHPSFFHFSPHCIPNTCTLSCSLVPRSTVPLAQLSKATGDRLCFALLKWLIKCLAALKQHLPLFLRLLIP